MAMIGFVFCVAALLMAAAAANLNGCRSCGKRFEACGFGFEPVRDVAAGEAIFFDEAGGFHSRQCAAKPQLSPCLFEYVYLARPDSVMETTTCRPSVSCGRRST